MIAARDNEPTDAPSSISGRMRRAAGGGVVAPSSAPAPSEPAPVPQVQPYAPTTDTTPLSTEPVGRADPTYGAPSAAPPPQVDPLAFSPNFSPSTDYRLGDSAPRLAPADTPPTPQPGYPAYDDPSLVDRSDPGSYSPYAPYEPPPTPAPAPAPPSTYLDDPTYITDYAPEPAPQTGGSGQIRGRDPNTLTASDVGTPSTPATPDVPPGEIAVAPPAPATPPPPPAVAPVDPTPAPAPAPVLPSIPGIANNPGTPAAPAPETNTNGSPPVQPAPASQYATATPTDPDNDLRGQTITPGPALDRFAIAQSQLKTFNDKTQPYYESALRSANRQAAATGRLGSGQLRTSLGDLANQRNLQLETQGQEFLNGALEGSAADSQANLAALLAEQQFQSQQQGQAFNQNVVGQQLQDALTNSAFGRALSLLGAGNANDPSSMQALLASLYGNQANAANGALSGLVGNTTANNASNNSSIQSLLAWLQAHGGTAPSIPNPSQTVLPGSNTANS